MQRRDNLTDIVADEAEARVAYVFLHDATQGHLGVLGHGIAFIENDEFKLFIEDRACASKVLDLIAYDVDAAIVRGVELEGHAADRIAIDLAS